MLCQFLLYSKVTQSYICVCDEKKSTYIYIHVHICIYICTFFSHLIFHHASLKREEGRKRRERQEG